jgi:hypothetical protein
LQINARNRWQWQINHYGIIFCCHVILLLNNLNILQKPSSPFEHLLREEAPSIPFIINTHKHIFVSSHYIVS